MIVVARLVAGAALLVLAVFLLILRARLRSRAAAQLDDPKRRLVVYDPALSKGEQPTGMVDLSGTITNPGELRAPVSGGSCALWEISLTKIIPAAYDSDEGQETLWVTGRSGDLVVAYDERLDLVKMPGWGRPDFRKSGPGRIDVPGAKVSFRWPGGSEKPIPGLSWVLSAGPKTADADVLEPIGLPANLLAEVRANPSRFVVYEGSIGTGEHVRLAQVPQQSDTYYVHPMGQEMIGAIGGGCAGMLLAIGAVLSAVTGIALLLLR